MARSRLFWIFVPVLVVIAVFVAVSLKYGWIVLPGGDGDGKTGGVESSAIGITPDSVCVKEGEKQQFEASVEGVHWSVEPVIPMDPTVVVAGVDQDGLLTAYEIGLATVVASKDGVYGYADLTVVPKDGNCNAMLEVGESDEGEEEIDEEEIDEEEGEDTKTKKEDNPYFGDSIGSTNRWLADFEATLEYEVNNGTETVGFVTHSMKGGFIFTVDYASGTLKLKQPAGFVNVEVSNEIVGCETTTINDSFLFVLTTDGKLVDTDFVFGKNFITSDHKEGVKMTCLDANFSDSSASMIDLLGQYAFPVTVEAKEGASTPFQATFSFAGRQAWIDGKVIIGKVKE